MQLSVTRGHLHAEISPGTPGVVFACGSALADRDGNDQDVGFAPLKQLAEQLTALGIGSLRFDRRGVGLSPGDFAGPEQTVQDFLTVIDQARELIGPELVLLGHAEGAGLAILAAGRTPCRGLILLAPPATFVRDLIEYGGMAEETLASTPKALHQEELTQLQAQYRARRRLFLLKPVLQVDCPILLIHGTMDWVYPPVESEQIAAELTKTGKPPTLAILPDLDHWLVQTQTWRSLEENLRPHWQVDARVSQQVCDWLAIIS
ncbi:S9 family peptidase [Candidatus Cyanaurora vandensis]|uniref:alpha/beta hydrolase family protein n=1 Tax=Candidatus Cyanaurora vandensis TaxID=2714958 RepID=UPI00257B05A3|nr:alpha/beta fold hydrolase [Candidatus Cyanaurora vandensis]